MQQGARWFFCHTRIAVGGPGDDTFEETKHAAYFRRAIQRGNNVDFRSARVCEARFHSTGHQGRNKTFCTIHLVVSKNPSRCETPATRWPKQALPSRNERLQMPVVRGEWS